MSWDDPAASWNAKLQRAKTHQTALGVICAAFRARGGVGVARSASGNRVEYRLRIHEPFPVDISLTVGDLVHNLRSALDAVLFAAIELDRGRELTESEERACQFPIESDPAKFDKTFTANKQWGLLTSRRVRFALRTAQPFYQQEQAKELGVGVDTPWRDWHPLLSLKTASDIDKHRRLAVAAAFPGTGWWFTTQNNVSIDARTQDAYADGDLILGFTGPDAPDIDLQQKISIVLHDLRRPSWAIRRDDEPDVVNVAAKWVLAVQTATSSFTQAFDHPELLPAP